LVAAEAARVAVEEAAAAAVARLAAEEADRERLEADRASAAATTRVVEEMEASFVAAEDAAATRVAAYTWGAAAKAQHCDEADGGEIGDRRHGPDPWSSNGGPTELEQETYGCESDVGEGNGYDYLPSTRKHVAGMSSPESRHTSQLHGGSKPSPTSVLDVDPGVDHRAFVFQQLADEMFAKARSQREMDETYLLQKRRLVHASSGTIREVWQKGESHEWQLNAGPAVKTPDPHSSDSHDCQSNSFGSSRMARPSKARRQLQPVLELEDLL